MLAGDYGDILSLAYGLCAITFLAVAAIALARRHRLPPGRGIAVAVAGAVTAAWAAGAAFVALPAVAVVMLEGVRVGAWLVVLVEIARLWRGRRLMLRGAAVILGTGAAAGLLAVAGPLLPVLGTLSLVPAGLLVLAILGLALIESILRAADDEGRWVVKHLCLGLAIMLAFDVFLLAESLLFGGMDAQLYAARGAVGALCALPVMVSLFRKPVPGRRLRPSREVVLRSSIVMAAGVYLLLMAVVGFWMRDAGGEWGAVTQVVFLIGSVLLLGFVFLSGASRARLRVMIAKNFFSHRYDYRAEWLRFTQTVAGGEDEGPDALHHRIVRAVCDIAEGSKGALYLHQERDRAFLPTAFWNLPVTLPALPDDAALVGFMRRRHWVVDLDEMRRRPALYGFEPPAWLAEADAWLVVPLVLRGEVLGMVVVAAPRVRRPLTWEDFDILKTVSRHAAATLATERALNDLSDARRLEAFSKRTAFLVHDVKNVVSQLDLMLKNADRFGHEPEFQKDMLETTAGAVEKLRKLLAELKQSREEASAEPAMPAAPSAAPAPAASAAGSAAAPDLARQVADAVTRWRRRKPDLRWRMEAEGLALPAPPAERLGSVLDHLVQNAIEAAGSDGLVEVALTPAPGGDGVAVAVTDDGEGMDPAYVRDHLFRPLKTSKDGGYGLGAFQSRELVREMGGRLDVTSRPGMGTTMRIVFPLAGAAPAGAVGGDARPVAREAV
ncbi:Multi-sensor Signal Transduction Histidine Kinase [Caenispirillum salinarum AK4]|uniref:histidine kinase n=1 Tax=Caenispirillum salinarum AK4 TaxID=1238182 RepID=K9HX74_9PROT|nr:XrtA/PEP-CTERM system histidine kinase PrsK [Caenispirillum salinarum]EKV32766.1 Multi-sensor Signal Transduction Histidine Kinase [Caenispirillum salinarum AK4]